ncbi:MAG: hypothetical protein CMQ20_01930 [Gammaproteobacteria bacterium]|jgi:MFS family permease|nr:hypothetical protein [Gammaproteobacteria bacterium]
MYYGWNIVGVGMVFQAISFGFTIYIFTFWAEAWMTEFNVGRTQITATFMIFNVAMGLVSPIAGRILDAFSIRVLIISGATCLTVGFLLISFANAMWQIITVYATLISVGSVLAGPLAAQTLAAKWFSARRGLAIGWGSTGTSIGGLLMPPFAIYLLLNLGWRQAHQVIAFLIVLIIVPLVWKIIRNTPQEKGVEPEAPARFEPTQESGGQAVQWTTIKVLRSRNFWIPIIAFLPALAAFSTVQANLSLITADIGISQQKTALLMSIIAGSMIVGKLFFGGMADRWDQRLLYWIAASIMGFGILLLMSQPNYTLMVFISVLLGLAAGGFLPLLGAIVGGRFGPEAFGQVFGLLGPFLTLSAFAPMLGGWLRDTTGSYDSIFQIILVALIPAMVSMAFMKRQAPATQASG